MTGTVVFDLDGTLADTSADLIAAANSCLVARGIGALLDPVEDALIAFQGGRAMLRTGYARMSADILLPPGAIDEDYQHLLDYYANDIARHTTLYPGTVEALDQLAIDGHLLSVCTNKPEALAQELLTKLGIRDRFKALIGADTLPVRKPDPRPYETSVRDAGGEVARSFLVGDTETDRKTAAAAGVRVALVAFGPEGAGLSRLKPEAMLEHFRDLPALARNWLA